MIALETCDNCGKDFVPRDHRHRTCSPRCRRALHYRENADRIRDYAQKNYAKRLARLRAKYKSDAAYREEHLEKNRKQARVRIARYIAMGLNANGKPRGKRGPKPKTKSQT